jgi:hypothetical protein
MQTSSCSVNKSFLKHDGGWVALKENLTQKQMILDLKKKKLSYHEEYHTQLNIFIQFR